jgi:hypothetical protein
VVLALGTVAVVCALFAGWSWRTGPGAPAAVVRFTLPQAPTGRTNSLGYNILSVAPDGRTLVHLVQGESRRQQLVVRTLDDITARPLPGRARLRSGGRLPERAVERRLVQTPA